MSERARRTLCGANGASGGAPTGILSGVTAQALRARRGELEPHEVARAAEQAAAARLKAVKVTSEMTATVERGMTQASAWTHDQAPALGRPPPTATAPTSGGSAARPGSSLRPERQAASADST